MAKYLDYAGLQRYDGIVERKIEGAVANKADIDGNYEDMAVGQLLSNTFEEDKAPYNFRTSGGKLEIGDREYDTLVGGTVAFNQFAYIRAGERNGITPSIDSDGVISLSGTSTAGYANIIKSLSPVVNHKYFISSKIVADPNSVCGNVYASFLNVTSSTIPYLGTSKIINITSVSGDGIGIAGYNTGIDFTGVKFKLIMCDLTQMFGSTIADYIYSLEQATAGSGVAYFRSLFPKDYYAYNAGQLMSVKALSHKMVGFNQFDKSTATQGKKVSSDGSIVTDNNYYVSDYIPSIPNTYYYFKNIANLSLAVGFAYYNKDKVFIGYSGLYTSGDAKASSGYLRIPNNCHYMRINTYKDYIDTCNVNLHWDGERDGEYEAYEEHIYPLDSDLELRGIPKLDANNNLYYDGDTYESDGTVTRKYGLYTFTGNESWTWYSDNEFWYTNLDLNPIAKSGGSGMNTKNLYMTFANGRYVRIYSGSNTGIDSTTNMNTILVNGDKLLYELDTPFTETADTFENPQLVDNWGTEEYTDSREVQIPVGHITKYPPDLKAKLESAPDSPASDGDYILRHNNGENSYVALTKELPAVPTTDGTYVLKATVSGGVTTLSWVAE